MACVMAGGIEPPATDTQERQKGHKQIHLCPKGLGSTIEAEPFANKRITFDSDPLAPFDPPAPLVRFVRFLSQERSTSSLFKLRQWPKNLNWGIFNSKVTKVYDLRHTGSSPRHLITFYLNIFGGIKFKAVALYLDDTCRKSGVHTYNLLLGVSYGTYAY